MTVALGLNERSAAGGGTIHNSLILIGPAEETLTTGLMCSP